MFCEPNAELLRHRSLVAQGEKLDELYAAIVESLNTPGPVAVVIKRKMAPGGKDQSNSLWSLEHWLTYYRFSRWHRRVSNAGCMSTEFTDVIHPIFNPAQNITR